MLRKKFIKMFVGVAIVGFFLAACVNNPYSYEDMPNIDNSVVRVESNMLKHDVYGYYYNGELNEFGECKKPNFFSYYECASEDGVRVLTHTTASSKYNHDEFRNPHLIIDGVDHKLICSSTWSNGDYCILEEDAIAAKENSE